MKTNKDQPTKYFARKFMAYLIILLSFSLLITSCSKPDIIEPQTIIGDEGVVFARAVATRYPYRAAGSPEEAQVADMIMTELQKMKYKPEIQECKTETITTSNIIVRIPGSGFETSTSSAVSATFNQIHRTVIVGAHYDTPIGTADAEAYPTYNGIHDNASGVGALLSVAKELKSTKNGYDVILVFFGAGHSNFLGAETFAASMTADEISSTDAMYCIDSIYAGDKLYAHAGQNALAAGTKYLMKRKLYEMSDVAIENGIDLRFNESDLDVDVNSDGTMDVYREVTSNRSDYSVFDRMKIPCVYIESYEYFESAVADQSESKNPYFGETKGKISGTKYDSIAYLDEKLEEDRLEHRIKNVTFLVVKAIGKGIYR